MFSRFDFDPIVSEQEKNPREVDQGRRAFLVKGLGTMAAVFGALSMKGSLRWLLSAGVVVSQEAEKDEHPTEEEVTLYRIHPKPAYERPEFKVQFENQFLPEMADLAHKQQQIVQELQQLGIAWRAAYEEEETYYTTEMECDSDNNCKSVLVQKTRTVWREPAGMSGYHGVISQVLAEFSMLQNDRLARIPLSYPVDHTESGGAGHDIKLESFVPKFYEDYLTEVKKVNGRTLALLFTSLLHAVLEYKGALSFLRMDNKHTGRFGDHRSSYKTSLGTEEITDASLKEYTEQLVGNMVESLSERLRNAGIFDAIQVFLLAAIVRRNMKKDWNGAYEDEEAFTRSFLHDRYTRGNAFTASGLGETLGVSSEQSIQSKRSHFSAAQPSLGYAGYPNFGERRARISTLMQSYAETLGATLSAHNGILRDIWLADAISAFQNQRKNDLREPAEGNARLILAALVIQVISIPFSGFHRNVVDAAMESIGM